MKKLTLCLSLALAAALFALGGTTALAAAPAQELPALAEDGASFTYQGRQVALGPRALYVDGRLSDDRAARSPYVYNSFVDAVAHLTDGTEAEPMELYLAPYVYWLHDPQAPEAQNMTGDYQLELACQNLHITGLADDPRNVVVAANFGHDVGFMGSNYTMFHITGDGLTLENLTFGDYCNVDLVYPPDPALNVPARAPGNITQGQIGVYDGDKLLARNVRFVSRLNMMPFNSAQRALYVDCHMESTDDSLNGSAQAVYLNCDFEFYSSKPWYTSSGVTLLDCRMKIVPINAGADTASATQYLVKSAGPFTVIDSSFVSDIPSADIGWSDVFDETFKSYYANVDFNGAPVTFSAGARPDAGVDLAGQAALRAFKLEDGTYNVYNLLRGQDDWDPLGQKAAVTAAGAADLPTSMTAYLSDDPGAAAATMVSGGENGTLTLGYALTGPQADTDYNAAAQVTWSVRESDRPYVKLTPNPDGTCTVEGTNTTEETALVIVTARDASGLEAAVALTVRPSVLPAPVFARLPAVSQTGDGAAAVTYAYDPASTQGRADLARITWYVCDDAQGTNPVAVAVGRGDTPLASIPLTQAMVGKYLMATVEPKHIRSDYGPAVSALSPAPIAPEGVPPFSGALELDLATFPVETQGRILPGFWTVDSVKPADTQPDTGSFPGGWTAACDGQSKWDYGTGVKNGTAGVTGLFNTDRGARLMYTPPEPLDREMELTLTLAPGKTAGQGFGSTNQYMDFMVKYDPAARTGWGLRIYRASSSECGFALVAHTADGGSALLTQPVISGMFLTETTVRVYTRGQRLYAAVSSTATEETVALSAYVPGLDGVTAGGVEVNHTGTAGDNAIYVTSLQIQWPERVPLLTRGDFVKALYNAYLERGGTPVEQEADFPSPDRDGQSSAPGGLGTYLVFSDVSGADRDLYHASAWAERHGATNGVGGGAFAPEQEITRMEAVAMAYRLAAAAGFQLPDGPAPALSPDWAREPAAWWALSGGETGDALLQPVDQSAADAVLAALFDHNTVRFP